MSKQFAGLIVVLSRSGYRHPRIVTLRNAWTDGETLHSYDASSDGSFRLSSPIVSADVHGEIQSILVRSEEEGLRLTRRLRAKGARLEFRREEKVIPQPPLTVQVSLSEPLRKMAAKTCISLVRHCGPAGLPTARWASRLLDQGSTGDRVRAVLGPARGVPNTPALAHAVHVEGDSEKGSCHGIVQYFGSAGCIHVVLDDNYTGPPFAIRGVLDIVSGREEFATSERVGLVAPSPIPTLDAVRAHFQSWSSDMNRQIREAFGNDSVVITTDSWQSAPTVSLTLPLVWMEYSIQMRVGVRARALEANRTDVALPTKVVDWRFRTTDGAEIDVFGCFQRGWDSGALSREVGRFHVYNASLPLNTQLRLLPEYWMQVEEFGLEYRVFRECWLGAISATCHGAILDLDSDKVTGNVRLQAGEIPKARDPSWPKLDGVERFMRKDEIHVVAEVSSIDLKATKIERMRMRRVKSDSETTEAEREEGAGAED